jgi:haloacetate dehalogenase
MAQDQVEVMQQLGYEQFMVVGHDRGARVGHRMALDHPQRVQKLAVLDIAPTLYVFQNTNQALATAYFHWFFLIQPAPFPETLIGSNAQYYFRSRLERWGQGLHYFAPEAVAEYERCFCVPEAIHASCEDYRAAASIDLEHDKADRGRRVACPLLALWGADGFVGQNYNVLGVWRDYAMDVDGQAFPGGHFMAEEHPDETYEALHQFLTRSQDSLSAA